MIGLPIPPGAVIENVSVVQSPTVTGVFPVVPATAEAKTNVCNKKTIQILQQCYHWAKLGSKMIGRNQIYLQKNNLVHKYYSSS